MIGMLGDHLELVKLGKGHPNVLNLGYIVLSDTDGNVGYMCRDGLGINEVILHLTIVHGIIHLQYCQYSAPRLNGPRLNGHPA